MHKLRLASAAVALLMVLPVVATAKDKKKPTPKGEDTVYGTVGCTVPPPPPPPGATQTPPDSAEQCLGRHGAIVIIEEPRRDQIRIENPEVVKAFDGQRVSASGYMNGESFHVVSVRGI